MSYNYKKIIIQTFHESEIKAYYINTGTISRPGIPLREMSIMVQIVFCGIELQNEVDLTIYMYLNHYWQIQGNLKHSE